MRAITRWVYPAVLGLSFVGQACGFLDQPRTDGRRLNDGVSPWSDLGAIQACIGGRRLVASIPREGLCRADAQAPASCEVDEDCPHDAEGCVCGRCVVPFCGDTSECREGQICAGSPRRCVQRCSDDTECGPYGVCSGGACEKACWSQDDCPVGELCLVGVCAAIGCGENGPNCFAGETCELQALTGALGGPAATTPAGNGGDRVVLYAELATAALPSAIMRFESEDGRSFVAVPETPVLLPSGAQTRVAHPDVVTTADGVVLFVELDGGASIGMSVDASGSGQSFPDATTVLVPGAWEGGAVRAPSAEVIDGTILLAYEGGAGAGIGLSIEDGSGAFTAAPEPALTPADFESPERWVDVTSIGAPDIRFVESSTGRPLLRLYATGYGKSLPAEPGGTYDVPSYSIAYAVAPFDTLADQPAFDILVDNPAFERVVNFIPLDESDSSVVPVGESWLMYYVDAGTIRVAVNPLVLDGI